MPIGFKRVLERILFATRWLLLLFYAGLAVALVALFAVFAQELIGHLPHVLETTVSNTTLWILSLIDMSLVANLLLIVILAGYRNFISCNLTQEHPDWPTWTSAIDFSGMKLKLIGSIAAISSIYLLEIFLRPEKLDPTNIIWLLAIQGMILASGVMLALMDFIASKSGEGH